VTVVGFDRCSLSCQRRTTSVGRRAVSPIQTAAFALVAALVWACAPVGIAEDWRVASVRVYNRTLVQLNVDGEWVLACSMDPQTGLPPWSSHTPSAPPEAIEIHVDLGVPAEFIGVLSVIISEEGVQVVRGEVDERGLGECAGRPPV
jgi:hypothetical protein